MSEPEHISKILPGVMKDIKTRCEENPCNKSFNPVADVHAERVMSAVAGFMSHRKVSRLKKRNR